ncbi:MAG: hypothetical protein V4722_19220 [Bacteroidota bacterium]
MKCRSLIAAWLMMTGTLAAQQIPTALATQLQGKTKLKDIMGTVKSYYGFTPEVIANNTKALPGSSDAVDPKVLRTLKHWARFEWEMSSRVTARGDMFDYNKYLLEQTRKYESANPAINAATQAAGGNWSLVGPSNVVYGHGISIGQGRIDRIAFHPTNASIFFVGSPSGGLWKTTNGGSSYACLTNSFPNLSVSGIVVDRIDPNIIYILTGDGDSGNGGFVNQFGYRRGGIGVWKTTDGGATWSQLGGAAVLGNGYKLVQSPLDANVLLAATTQGIFRTGNGGITWTQSRTGVCQDVAFKPGTGLSYACGDDPGANNYWFEISVNGGVTFSDLSTFGNSITGTNRACIGVSPNSANTVYLLCGVGNISNNTFLGFYRSTNSGTDFTLQSTSPNVFGDAGAGVGSDQSGYDNCIAVNPGNINRIIVGGLVVFGSSNGGSNFSNLTTYSDGITGPSDTYVHPDQHALEYNPLDSKLYVCNDGGVYMSSDNGATWTPKYANLPTTASYHLAVYDGDPSQLLIGNQDNGIQLREDGGSTFHQAGGGDGFDMDFMHNDEDDFFGVVNTKVYRYTYDGLSSSLKLDFVPNFFPSMAIHETNTDRIFTGITQFHRYEHYCCSSDVDDVFNVSCSWAIATCPSWASRIYIAGDVSFASGTTGTMRRSDDGGSTWTRLDLNTGFPDMTLVPKITYICAKPNNSDWVWITIGGGPGVPGRVYFSSNAGATWSNITQGLPDVPVNCIAVDANNNAYVGTDFGVFYRGSGWSSWKPFSNNLPRCPVTDIKLSPSIFKVRASLFGRGVWETDQYSDCNPDVTVSGTKEGQQYFEASSTVTTTATSNDGPGTQIFYRGGNLVDMKPGFEIANTAAGNIVTGPCNSGIPVFSKVFSDTTNDYSNFRYAKMPPADKRKFPYAFIKDWEWKNNMPLAKIEQVKEGALSLILVDDAGEKIADLWSRAAMVQGAVSVALPFDPQWKTKKLSVLLFHNNQLVHWQELN